MVSHDAQRCGDGASEKRLVGTLASLTEDWACLARGMKAPHYFLPILKSSRFLGARTVPQLRSTNTGGTPCFGICSITDQARQSFDKHRILSNPTNTYSSLLASTLLISLIIPSCHERSSFSTTSQISAGSYLSAIQSALLIHANP